VGKFLFDSERRVHCLSSDKRLPRRSLYRCCRGSYLFLGRKDFLNTDLVNEVFATQVNQMNSLLVVRQVRTDAVDHYYDESAIIHIEPIRTADELVFAVPDEWTVKIGGEVRLVKRVMG
jgi:hypothetical protein